MHTAELLQIQPILGARALAQAVRFYVDRLGFTLAFGDPSIPVNYVGLRRDGVELHMQFQYEHEMKPTRLRFVVDDPDALYEEYKAKDVLDDGTQLKDTSWGTRELRALRLGPKCVDVL